MIISALFSLAYMYVFWCLYVLVMGIYRANLSGKLNGFTKLLSYPIVIIAVLVDIICQYTIATIFFFELPRLKEYMVTSRLSRYVTDNTDWRHTVASYICDNMLDIFDPKGNHC